MDKPSTDKPSTKNTAAGFITRKHNSERSVDSVYFQFHNLGRGQVPYAALPKPAQVRPVDALDLEVDQLALRKLVAEILGFTDEARRDSMNLHLGDLICGEVLVTRVLE